MNNYQFVVASHNENVLQENLFQSEMKPSIAYPPIVMRGYTNVPEAYNDSKPKADIVIYVHHDVFLPRNFKNQLEQSLYDLPENWEVAGVAGVRLDNGEKVEFGNIRDRGRNWGYEIKQPVPVDTIDELMLITRGPIKFDPQFEQDFYGADICIGRNCYVIPGYLHHNSSRPMGGRTESFYKSEKLFRIKHADKLPIATTCSLLLP